MGLISLQLPKAEIPDAGPAAATLTAEARETGAGVRKVVYSSAGHVRRWGTSAPKSFFTSQCRQRVLQGRRRKAEQRDQGEEVEKFSVCRPAQSIPIRTLKLLN